MQRHDRIDQSRQTIWNTQAARPAEQFAYYREAICRAFMNLTPEPPSTPGFPARVESIRLGEGAVNRVVFPEHVVRRSASDIAASTQSCFYLNLKLAGRCVVRQAGREVSLSRGQVGIFDSERQFSLHHGDGAPLRVASFWVPAEGAARSPAGRI